MTTLPTDAPRQVESGRDARIPFGRLVHAELRKLSDTRASRWLLGALLACAPAVNGGTAPVTESTSHKAAPSHLLVYIGSYTQKSKTGITLLDLDTKTGALVRKQAVYDGPNATYLVLSPDQKHLYAANEIDNFGGNRRLGRGVENCAAENRRPVNRPEGGLGEAVNVGRRATISLAIDELQGA